MSLPAHFTPIKICGLTREQDVDAAVQAGVQAIGFVLYEPSPRCVNVARAAELARRLPAFVNPVPRCPAPGCNFMVTKTRPFVSGSASG